MLINICSAARLLSLAAYCAEVHLHESTGTDALPIYYIRVQTVWSVTNDIDNKVTGTPDYYIILTSDTNHNHGVRLKAIDAIGSAFACLIFFSNSTYSHQYTPHNLKTDPCYNVVHNLNVLLSGLGMRTRSSVLSNLRSSSP